MRGGEALSGSLTDDAKPGPAPAPAPRPLIRPSRDAPSRGGRRDAGMAPRRAAAAALAGAVVLLLAACCGRGRGESE